MATRISLGPKAPDEKQRFYLSEWFTVASDKPYETNNPHTIADMQMFVEREWVVLEYVENATNPEVSEPAALKQFDKAVEAAAKSNAQREDIVAEPLVEPEHDSHVEIMEEASVEDAPKKSTRKGAKS